ncbi:alpha/beta hydrolase [Marinifilum sp.]|uniref:alpha/beta hydrolase n=1 Tax=Marinifilum sp. TaxID=2033137 RepID=UPI003BA91FF8
MTLAETKAQTFKAGKNMVSFTSDGEKIAAHLFLPADYEVGKNYPAVIVTPPATGVKEQTAGIYAEALSKKGFLTLTFDPRGWGESGGRPFVVHPDYQVRDCRNAVNYVMTLDATNKDNVFNLGICMGTGWAAYETAFDTRIKGLAMISPYLLDLNELVDLMGGSDKFRATLIAPTLPAAQSQFESGEDFYIKPVPETEEEIKMADPISIGMRDYYLPGKPGDVPNWKNKGCLNESYTLYGFSIFNYTKLLESTPKYVAYGDQAVSKGGAIKFVNATNPEKVTVIEGEGHFDLYWKPEHVARISDEISDFFKEQIK